MAEGRKRLIRSLSSRDQPFDKHVNHLYIVYSDGESAARSMRLTSVRTAMPVGPLAR